jgi:hypothetical protein
MARLYFHSLFMSKRLLCLWLGTAACCSSVLAFAESYTSSDGYLEVIGYKLQLINRDNKAEITVTGRVEALADCNGVDLTFDVFDGANRKLGVFRATHDAIGRHDVWVLGPGVFAAQDGAKNAAASADHVVARDAECRRY